MPGTKEIRSKIASVKSTQKITKAMQMVATSKMRRAQERMRLARPYAQKMRNVIGHLGDRPHVKDLIGTVKVMLDAYRAGALDRLLLVNAQFVNTMTQRAAVEQLLPIEALDTEGLQEHWDYIYEPEAAYILDGLLMRYIESQVYRGAVENVASEMAARMVAMKAASDNAGKLITELQLIYNKARQAAITKELSEIVGGAAAV